MGLVPDNDVQMYTEAHLNGTIDLSKLIGAQYNLDQINEAAAELQRGTSGRIIIDTNA